MSEMNRLAMDPDLLPGSGLPRACAYALRLRSELRRSLSNGVTEIDNNRCEQSIRPIGPWKKKLPAAMRHADCGGMAKPLRGREWAPCGQSGSRAGGGSDHEPCGELQANGNQSAHLP